MISDVSPNIYNRWLVFDTHIGLCTSHGVVTPGPRHSRFTLSTRKIVLSPGSLNSTFETISFTRLDPNLIIRFKTKMHVVSNEFLILNSRLNIQSYSRTRTPGETSSYATSSHNNLFLTGRSRNTEMSLSSSSYYILTRKLICNMHIYLFMIFCVFVNLLQKFFAG